MPEIVHVLGATPPYADIDQADWLRLTKDTASPDLAPRSLRAIPPIFNEHEGRLRYVFLVCTAAGRCLLASLPNGRRNRTGELTADEMIYTETTDDDAISRYVREGRVDDMPDRLRGRLEVQIAPRGPRGKLSTLEPMEGIGSTSPEDSAGSLEARAMALLAQTAVEGRKLNVTAMAKQLNVGRTSLYKIERFTQLLEQIRAKGQGPARSPRRGSKDAETGEIIASDDEE